MLVFIIVTDCDSPVAVVHDTLNIWIVIFFCNSFLLFAIFRKAHKSCEFYIAEI